MAIQTNCMKNMTKKKEMIVIHALLMWPKDFQRPLTVIAINRMDLHNIHIFFFCRSRFNLIRLHLFHRFVLVMFHLLLARTHTHIKHLPNSLCKYIETSKVHKFIFGKVTFFLCSFNGLFPSLLCKCLYHFGIFTCQRQITWIHSANLTYCKQLSLLAHRVFSSLSLSLLLWWLSLFSFLSSSYNCCHVESIRRTILALSTYNKFNNSPSSLCVVNDLSFLKQ